MIFVDAHDLSLSSNEAVEKVALILLRSGSECKGADDGALQVCRYEPTVFAGGAGRPSGAGVDAHAVHHLARSMDGGGGAAPGTTADDSLGLADF